MNTLKAVPNTDLFDEVALRLKDIYRTESGGKEFEFGCFKFTFHRGRFEGIEVHLNNKFYWRFSRSGEKPVLLNTAYNGASHV